MSDEQRKPLPTGTLLYIEGGIAAAMLVAAVAIRPAMAIGALLIVAGLIFAASVPVTLGVLWNDPRTSAATRGLTLMLAMIQPMFFLVHAASTYVRRRPAAPDLVVGMAYCGAMLLLYFLGRGIRSWADRHPSG